MIWFQHFHKCAGTFFIVNAQKAGYHPLPESNNGNPCRAGKEIPLWEFDTEHLRQWIRSLGDHNRLLICTESGLPELDAILEVEDARFVTVIRDPWRRYLSNYIYDAKCGFTAARSIVEYYNSSGIYSGPNYYLKTLCRNKHAEDEDDLALALKRLEAFDKIFIQEDPSFSRDILQFFGLSTAHPVRPINKPSRFNLAMILLAFRRKWYRNAFNALIFPFRKEDYDEFRKVHFDEANRADRAIYDAARALAIEPRRRA